MNNYNITNKEFFNKNFLIKEIENNYFEIIFSNEDHTIGNLLQTQLPVE